MLFLFLRLRLGTGLWYGFGFWIRLWRWWFHLVLWNIGTCPCPLSLLVVDIGAKPVAILLLLRYTKFTFETLSVVKITALTSRILTRLVLTNAVNFEYIIRFIWLCLHQN